MDLMFHLQPFCIAEPLIKSFPSILLNLPEATICCLNTSFLSSTRMPYAARGSVEGCGIAPGPALKLANWIGWVIFFISSIIYKLVKLRGSEGELIEIRTFGWSGYLALFQLIGYLAAVIYSLYDLTLGYEAGISGPGAMLSYVLFLREFRYRDRTFIRSIALYLPVVFILIAWIAAYIITARGAGIIVDETKLPGCLATAQDFLDTQDLGLKRSLPAVMFVCNIVLVVSDFAWRRGKLDGDIFFVWAGYIIFGTITLVLHIVDAFVGIGQEFGCDSCSINSGLGYYNYRVNWYKTKNGAVRQGHGAWYQIQNAFQS
jgi:hypothetical protein